MNFFLNVFNFKSEDKRTKCINVGTKWVSRGSVDSRQFTSQILLEILSLDGYTG